MEWRWLLPPPSARRRDSSLARCHSLVLTSAPIAKPRRISEGEVGTSEEEIWRRECSRSRSAAAASSAYHKCHLRESTHATGDAAADTAAVMEEEEEGGGGETPPGRGEGRCSLTDGREPLLSPLSSPLSYPSPRLLRCLAGDSAGG